MTILLKAIERREWRSVIKRIKTTPHEATYAGEASSKGGQLVPLHQACKGKPPAVIVSSLIAAYPAATSTKCDGSLPLHLALRYGASLDVIMTLLLACPGSLDEEDIEGNKPIEIFKNCKSEWTEQEQAIISRIWEGGVDKIDLNQNEMVSGTVAVRKDPKANNSLIPELEEEDWKQAGLIVVVIGASGDLAKKKTYPSLLHLFAANLLPNDTQIWGYARSKITHEELRAKIRPFIEKSGDASVIDAFLSQCFYKQGKSYGDQKAYQELATEMSHYEMQFSNKLNHNRLFYFAIPPNVFAEAGVAIKKSAMADKGWTRIIVEKPFGRDLESCEEILSILAKNFEEDSLYRIDHYLGKEMVQNLLVLRFGNQWFERIWDRNSIQCVFLTFKEPFGTDGRGGYFDNYGIIRDIIQNHLLQVMTLLAMEAPTKVDGPEAGRSIRDAKVQVLKSMEPIEIDDCCLGQYEGYTDDETIKNKETNTPTFAAIRCYVNNPRWAGVPFIFKAGKALNERKAEMRIQFKDAPASKFLFDHECARNELVIRMQPDEAIYFKTNVKSPGFSNKPVQSELEVNYNTKFAEKDVGKLPDAYSRLILDVLRGRSAAFVREDELRKSWELFTPLLHKIENENIQPHIYKFGSRGPVAANSFITKESGYVRNEEYVFNNRKVTTDSGGFHPTSKAPLTQEELKKMAGYKAVDDYVTSGMVIGLGTGSTSYYAVERVGELLKSGKLRDIVAIPTSVRTKEQAERLGIPLATLDTHSKLDVAIDGADNVDPNLNLVKGGGGALLREKMVEVCAEKFIVIVDESKLCDALGPGFPVPVEITQFCYEKTLRTVQALPSCAGCNPVLRMGSSSNNKVDGEEIAVTDNGNFIIDLHFSQPIKDAPKMAEEINNTVGVVDHGLFCGLTTAVIIAGSEGISVKERENCSQPRSAGNVAQCDIGLYGIAVMGQRFALNIASHGFTVCVGNRSHSKVDELVRIAKEEGDLPVIGSNDPEDFIMKLKRPRKVILLLQAGKPVDLTISTLSKYMEPGDIIADGGNEWFPNSIRRGNELDKKGIMFIGMGISGEGKAVRNGPCIMSGGPKEAYDELEPILSRCAAQAKKGACSGYVGPIGSGDYLKMVHNGIAYGDMQMIAEAYDIMKNILGMGNDEISQAFKDWSKGPMKSYLIKITAKILSKKDGLTSVGKGVDIKFGRGQNSSHVASYAQCLDMIRATAEAYHLELGMSVLVQVCDIARKLIGTSSDQMSRQFESMDALKLESYNALNQEHPDSSNKGMSIMNSFINDIFERIAGEARKLGSFKEKTILPKKGGITAKTHVVDYILDKTGMKGTGKWAVQEAAEVSVAAPAISGSLNARFLSGIKDERVKASSILNGPERVPKVNKQELIDNIGEALYASKICSYAQGFSMIKAASDKFNWNIDLAACAKLWRKGCIIRSPYLDRIQDAFEKDPGLPNLMLNPLVARELSDLNQQWRDVVITCALHGITCPSLGGSLTYYDSYRAETLPANLTQAHRDFFGGHTYERTDIPGIFHCVWTDTHKDIGNINERTRGEQ